MRTVGERWHEGKCSIAQEHMLTNLLTGSAGVAGANLFSVESGGSSFAGHPEK